MNFIDWENEFDAVCEADEKIARGEDPLYGIDIETFEAIRREEDEASRSLFGVKRKFYEKFPIKVATKNSTDKQCSICIRNYKIGC